ncbi:hypothetical protein, partial [Enterococcus faecium]
NQPEVRRPPNAPRAGQLLFEAAVVTLISALVGSQDLKSPMSADLGGSASGIQPLPLTGIERAHDSMPARDTWPGH